MRDHKIFLLLWALELTALPILALLDFGFGAGLDSNYFPRFGYLAAFLVAAYHVLSKSRGIPAHPLFLVFFIIFIVGAAKGLGQGTFNSAFISHCYYVVMPFVLCWYGWHFVADLQANAALKRRLDVLMRGAFYVGLVVVLLFNVLLIAGVASYDAIGLWNFFFSGPYLLQKALGGAYFITSFLMSALAGKRSVLAAMAIYLPLLFLMVRGGTRARLLVLAPAALVLLWFGAQDMLQGGLIRIERSIAALQAGNWDAASGMRWSEAVAALSHIATRADHWLLGTGFGAQYLPYPDLAGYEHFFRHYTHFGVISYIWIGGILAPIAVYSILLYNATLLVWRSRPGGLLREQRYFAYWLCGIIALSMFGAVLMTNSFLWFLIGCCLRLNRMADRPALYSSAEPDTSRTDGEVYGAAGK
ncbi:hypothetical protein [Alkalilimnicola sp. S0819]|uniref:hypothetical protein n=1 Tax=Alkalilimnicola sp. S0819 TaxID=2613922 RepID=UPI00126193CB|nr:hypothetical protein [Alkalilimnicola sp. S0819]KAB7628244.1 hypothetical protein F3N43_00595 [Alkalilimnicola sp. S0819]MPQ15135.1 hypothetical protein [Alkalilimnicola sp. S0819]